MRVNVLLSPLNADELFFSEKTTVVIDVLRASSSVITALNNGAREVIPVETMEFAMKISGGQNLLAGERNAMKIEGFDLGNSPLEFTEETVKGKSVILYTSNGSKAFVRAKFSEHLYVCSFMNIEAVANKLLEDEKDFIVLCAGSNGMFSLEDTVCAGKLIELVKAKNSILDLSDSAKASLILSNSYGDNIEKMLEESEHGLELINAGYKEDLKLISQINSVNIIPFLESGTIKINKKNSEDNSAE